MDAAAWSLLSELNILNGAKRFFRVSCIAARQPFPTCVFVLHHTVYTEGFGNTASGVSGSCVRVPINWQNKIRFCQVRMRQTEGSSDYLPGLSLNI